MALLFFQKTIFTPLYGLNLRAPSRARILVIRQKRAVQDELINVHSATAP